MKRWTQMSLPNRILIFIVIGVVAGLIMGPDAQKLKPIGDIFVRLVMMMVILLVTPALISGMAELEDPKKIGRVGIKITVIFILTTVIAGIMALLLGNILGPGRGLEMALPEGFKYTKPTQTMMDVLTGVVPRNPVAAFAEGNLLSILFVVLFMGFALSAIGEKGRVMRNFFAEWTQLSMKMLAWIMELAPFGAGALIAYSVGVHGPKVLGPLGFFVLVVYIGEVLILVEYTLIMLVTGLNPVKFFRTMIKPMMVSFTTCSSMATLPVNVEATERMGVPNGVATFGITLGNVINMDGTALYQALAVLFVSQVYALPLSLADQVMVVFMASVVTISMVGVPGAGTATLGLLLMAVGLPVEGIGLVLAVDRICDMPRTMNNVIGDSMVTIVSAKTEKLLEPGSILLKGN